MVAGLAVGAGEGVRNEPQPLAQQAIDPGGREAVADFLQARRIGAAEDAVVERLERDPFARELVLGIFVAVEAEFRVERKVAAEFEEERPKIAVDGVDVVVVHHRGRAHDPRVGRPGGRAFALLGAEHGRLLLRLADEQDAFPLPKAAQMFGHHVVLALALAERNERKPCPGHEAFQRRHEGARHRVHQRGRRQRLAAMGAEELHDPLFVLQPRHEHVEIHAVDPLDRQPLVILEDIGHALC